MSWLTIPLGVIQLIGEAIGLVSKAKQVVTNSTPEPEPVDAEKARAGTLAGGAQYVAGRNAGKANKQGR